MKLSIIMPTCGRAQIKRQIELVRDSGGQDYELLISGDGPQPKVEKYLSELDDSRIRYFHTDKPTNDRGCSQRDLAIENAVGTHYWFIDDDDELAPGALNIIQRAVEPRPAALHGFRVGDCYGSVQACQVTTASIVFPSSPMSRWVDDQHGASLADFRFIDRMIKLRNESAASIVWHDQSLYRVLQKRDLL